MFRKLRTHLNPASLIATVALFAALGGVSYAAATIDGKNIKSKTIAGKKLKDKTVTGGKVKSDSLTGAQVNESTLGKVPSATSADQAGHASTAAKAATADNAATAENATNAVNATNATTAANATAIANDTVASSKVQDGTLTGQDVGRRAGSNAFSIGSVPAGTCEVKAALVSAGADMRDDALSITAEQNLAAGLTVSSENSDSVGFIRINVCNVTGAAVDGGTHVFHWVAFDV